MPIRTLFVTVTLLLVFMIPMAPPAQAERVTTISDCEKSPFSGSWVSTDADTPFLSKLEVSDICKQIISKPVDTSNPWAGVLGTEKKYTYREYTLRPSSTCMPMDCVWGKSKGKIGDKGSMKAGFRMFWSQRFLELTRENENLRVAWRIQYIGRTKPDQLGETLLVRAQ